MGSISYETHFKSQRADGRFVGSLAAFTERLRNMHPELSLPEKLDEKIFSEWRDAVKEKYRELLRLPEIKKQEPPKRLSTTVRDGYRVEKWEFYPDEYTVVPFLALIPVGSSRKQRVPGVVCLPGSVHSKEFISGEPLLEPYNCRFERFPERNRMALYMVKNGMAAFVFDNIATAETGIPTTDETSDVWNYHSRTELVYGYLQAGLCYPGMSTYIILSFLQYLECFDFLDSERLGVSAHSLGTEAAMSIGVLSDKIRAVVFNDYLSDDRVRYSSTTESSEGNMGLSIGFWHTVPGMWGYFGFPDLCAAIAPKHLAFNEGGADEWFDKVRRAYKSLSAEDRLQIGHYPKYEREDSRNHHGKVPRYGLSAKEYYEWNYCDPEDHSFREEPSVRLLKKAFEIL